MDSAAGVLDPFAAVFERKVCNVCGSVWTAPPDACPSCASGAPQPHAGAGFEYDSLSAFRTAARALKAAEDALIAARQAYAEAVKALSEEAVR